MADFEIDAEGSRVRCPEGHETRHFTWVWVRPGVGKAKVQVKCFRFDQQLCGACPRYEECVTDRRRRGRCVTLHPDEELLQAARALEQTEYFRQQYRRRVVVEHRIGRLVQLGIRQARYVGRAKTLFQLLLAATVANLTLVANGKGSGGLVGRFAVCMVSVWRGLARLDALRHWWPALAVPIAA